MYHGPNVLILRGIYVEVAVQQSDPSLLRFWTSTVVTLLTSKVRAASPLRSGVLFEVRDQNSASSCLAHPFLGGIRVLGGRTRLFLRGLMLF